MTAKNIFFALKSSHTVRNALNCSLKMRRSEVPVTYRHEGVRGLSPVLLHTFHKTEIVVNHMVCVCIQMPHENPIADGPLSKCMERGSSLRVSPSVWVSQPVGAMNNGVSQDTVDNFRQTCDDISISVIGHLALMYLHWMDDTVRRTRNRQTGAAPGWDLEAGHAKASVERWWEEVEKIGDGRTTSSSLCVSGSTPNGCSSLSLVTRHTLQIHSKPQGFRSKRC